MKRQSMVLEQMEEGVRVLLLGMGVDLRDANFKDTPRRVAKMYAEMLTPPEVEFTIFPADSSDLVLLRGHRAIGLCPHHLMPVEYRAHIGYIPAKKTVGLSKLARVVNAQLTYPMLHEDLAAAVAMRLENALRPKGVGVVLVGAHGCMRFRGIESQDADVVVSVMRGLLLKDAAAKAEFMQLVGRP